MILDEELAVAAVPRLPPLPVLSPATVRSYTSRAA